MIIAMILVAWTAQAANYVFEGKVDGIEVSTPYITVPAENNSCVYPHYCNHKGNLVRLNSNDSKINQIIYKAMNDNSFVHVEGNHFACVDQVDGWQVCDLNVTALTK
jgi:hypothetical protein